MKHFLPLLRFEKIQRETKLLIRYGFSMVLPLASAWIVFELLRVDGLEIRASLLVSQISWLIIAFPFARGAFGAERLDFWRSFWRWLSTWLLTVMLGQAGILFVSRLFGMSWIIFGVNALLVALTTYLLSRLWVFANR